MNHARRHRLRGASMVEFAIVFPAAVLFVLALIQVGFLYMAKLTLNHAAFMAARAGSLNHARVGAVRETLIRGLGPFYQDSTIASDPQRLLDGSATIALRTPLPFDEYVFIERDPTRCQGIGCRLNSCTASTSTFTCSGSMSGDMPWPRLNTCPGASP